MSFTTLIDAVSLAENLGRPDWCVVDVRHQLADVGYGERAYLAGHIPGAFFLHCDRDLSGVKTGANGRHPLPDPEKFAALLRACGMTNQTQVIVYDDAHGMISGRLWWMLRWLGHDRVAVLDGGLPAWVAIAGRLTEVLPAVVPGDFQVRKLASVVDVGEVLLNLENASHQVIDARSPDRFRGENESVDPVGGHIPGAINRFFRANLGEDGCFKPKNVLRAEWQALLAGMNPELMIHQCGSGVSACHNLLSMEIAGFSGSRLYPGSWSEWCVDCERPRVG